jgi:hypothetical protein
MCPTSRLRWESRLTGYRIRVTHAETEITAELVRDLLRDQHPDLADRPLSLGARGWDNTAD